MENFNKKETFIHLRDFLINNLIKDKVYVRSYFRSKPKKNV